MTCRACGAQIADKAIVCYKCGTPTADEAARAPVRRPVGPNWLAVAVLLVVMAVSGWLVTRTPPGSLTRIAAWTGLGVAAAGTVLALRRR